MITITMKIDKKHFALLIMIYKNNDYDASFNVSFIDTLFEKTVKIEDSLMINNTENPLSDEEIKELQSISELINKELNSKKYELEQWQFVYSNDDSNDIDIYYTSDMVDSGGHVQIDIKEDNEVSKRVETLSKKITERIFDKCF